MTDAATSAGSVPSVPVPGPHDPVTTTPARAPGSVRRTSSLDSSRPDGSRGRLVIDGRARDLVTGLDSTVARVTQVKVRLTVDEPSREIVAVEVEGSPSAPDLDALVGVKIVGGFRRVLGEVLPDERRSRSLAHLLLDDLPGATLVSGYALLRAGQVGRSPAGGAHHFDGMADLCAGWAADGSMLQVTRATGVVPTPGGPPAPAIEAPDDPMSWHGMAPLPADGMRRRRRLDLAPAGADGTHAVDLHFRDSHNGEDGESVLHEYTVVATVDGSRLTALTPRAQVLPWQECPGALLSAPKLVGATLDEIAGHLRHDLVGVTSCTHLNDTYRSLADLSALLALLPRLPRLP
jgi:hypothetical protein